LPEIVEERPAEPPEAPVRAAPGDKPNLVVYLADALRADHLGCYGHRIPTSPRIDAFGARSIVFEQCFSQASWTKPSISSIFTGVLPRVHQAAISHFNIGHLHDFPVQVLRDSFVTLAESLRDAGYHTGLFETNAFIQPEFGYEQGFDHYWFTNAAGPKRVTDEVVEWLEHEAREPFFLFIHEFDPHGPYLPPVLLFEKLFGTTLATAEAALSSRDASLLVDLKTWYGRGMDQDRPPKPPLTQLSAQGLRHLRALYEGDIAMMDRGFDALLAFLESKRLLDRTVVALTADHGEGFNEHGQFGHGNTLFDEEIHVPLVIRAPGRREQLRVPWTVSLFDLYPTLTALAGASTPHYVQALPLLDETGACVVDRHRTVFADLDRFTPEVDQWDCCMVGGPAKMIVGNRGESIQLYDRHADPRERRNLFTPRKAGDPASQRLFAAFEAERRRHAALADQFGEPVWTKGTKEHREQLDALGYV